MRRVVGVVWDDAPGVIPRIKINISKKRFIVIMSIVYKDFDFNSESTYLGSVFFVCGAFFIYLTGGSGSAIFASIYNL